MDEPKGVVKLSKAIKVSRKTISIRLRELEMDGFIKRLSDSRNCKWIKTKEGEKFMNTVLGIDESGIKSS